MNDSKQPAQRPLLISLNGSEYVITSWAKSGPWQIQRNKDGYGPFTWDPASLTGLQRMDVLEWCEVEPEAKALWDAPIEL